MTFNKITNKHRYGLYSDGKKVKVFFEDEVEEIKQGYLDYRDKLPEDDLKRIS